MSDAIIAWVRTIVPVGVGAALAWLLTLGIELDKTAEEGLVVGLTALIIAAYYSLVKVLEKRWPKLGVLLGVAKTADGYSQGEPRTYSSTSETPIFDSVNSESRH